MPDLGVPELLIVAVIVLLLFGPGKAADIGGALGKSLREFRKASNEPDGAEAPVASTAASTADMIAPAADVTAATEGATRFCTECGTRTTEAQKFCTSCGASVLSTATN